MCFQVKYGHSITPGGSVLSRFISDPLIFRVCSLMKTAVIRKRMQFHTKKCCIFLKCLSQKKNIITQKGKEDWFGESDAF